MAIPSTLEKGQEVFIPNLYNNAGILTDKRERAAYIIKQFVYNPGNISNYFEDELASLRLLAAYHGYKKENMIDYVKRILVGIFNYQYPDDQIEVEVTARNINEIRYAVNIQVKITDMSSGISGALILKRSIEVTENNEFILHLTPTY
jgi:hypothetical protein